MNNAAFAEQNAALLERGGYSVSALIRSGWTKTMIERLLGAPDREAANPYYSSGHRMQLYDVNRVRMVEQTEAFRALQDGRRKSRA